MDESRTPDQSRPTPQSQGAAVAQSQDTPPPLPFHSVNEHGVVVKPVPCRGCGYVLQGFTLAQVCPECGWPVSRSVQDTTFRHSPPAYLRMLRACMGLILLTVTLDVIPTFSVVILDIIRDNFKVSFERISIAGLTITLGMDAIHIGAEAISTLAAAGTVWGFWRMTTPDPALSRRQQPTSAHWILRLATLSAAGTGLMSTVIALLQTTGNSPRIAHMVWVVGTLDVLVYVLTAAWISAAMAFFGMLAARIPDPTLARHCKTMIWLSWVLLFPGMLACFAGPIAAIIYVYIALVRLRSGIGRVLVEQDAEPQPAA